jgi:hypothetical protein
MKGNPVAELRGILSIKNSSAKVPVDFSSLSKIFELIQALFRCYNTDQTTNRKYFNFKTREHTYG